VLQFGLIIYGNNFVMSRRMKKYKEELCFLGTCKKNQRQNFIRQASSEIINALGDAIKTLLTGNLPISTYYRNKLRKDISKLKLLSSKGGILKKKKFLQSQRGGSLLGTIWNVVKNLF
jgi:hypothetical protein